MWRWEERCEVKTVINWQRVRGESERKTQHFFCEGFATLPLCAVCRKAYCSLSVCFVTVAYFSTSASKS